MSIEKTLNDFIEQAILQVRTGMLCKVITFDQATHTASLQPLIKQKIQGQPEEPLPPIPDAPVVRHIEELSPGDIVVTLAVDRAIDEALSGQMAFPADRRHHSLFDSIVIGVI